MSRLLLSPPGRPPVGEASPPGSKSHTIRALFAAASAGGESVLRGGLDAADTRSAARCLELLGASVQFGSTGWLVQGVEGNFSAPTAPLPVGESGLTARFALAFSPHIPGPISIEGAGRLPERPMADLLQSFADRGARVGYRHPWRIDATDVTPGGEIDVDASSTTQLASGLLLAAPLADRSTTLTLRDVRSSRGYVEVTVGVMRAFGAEVEVDWPRITVEPTGYEPRDYAVPTDASSSVYPACAAAISGGTIRIHGDPSDHPDSLVFEILARMGCTVETGPTDVLVTGPEALQPIEVDMSAAPDGAVALAVVASRARGTSIIHGLESLRLKESDRLAALDEELTRYGAEVKIEGDSIRITPGPARAGVFDTHNDHRIAMSIGLLGLVGDGIVIESAGVVEKTWPGYWEWLAEIGVGLTESE